MSFSSETEKLVDQLIQAEYLNAVVNYGEKYHSLHEGYAVLLEEVEEVKTEVKDFKCGCKELWEQIKDEQEKKEMIRKITFLNASMKCAMQELAQVGAVLQKIKNTLGVEEC